MDLFLERFRNWASGFFRPRPIHRWEWIWMRLLFAFILWFNPLSVWDFLVNDGKFYFGGGHFADFHPFDYDQQKSPVGIAKIMDLTWLSNPGVETAFRWIAGICLLIYVSGYGLVFALPVLTIVSLLTRTLENSQGSLDHTHQITTLVLLAQTVVVLYYSTKGRKKLTETLKLRSYIVYYTQGVILGTYVTAAISKILNSKGLWLWNSPYISLDLVKGHRQAYYKNLDPAFAHDPHWPMLVLENPMMSRFILAGGFFIELLALFGLRSRGWAFIAGLGLIALHQGIFLVLHHWFLNNQFLLVIFLLNIPFWVWWLTNRMRGNHSALSVENP